MAVWTAAGGFFDDFVGGEDSEGHSGDVIAPVVADGTILRAHGLCG